MEGFVDCSFNGSKDRFRQRSGTRGKRTGKRQEWVGRGRRSRPGRRGLPSGTSLFARGRGSEEFLKDGEPRATVVGPKDVSLHFYPLAGHLGVRPRVQEVAKLAVRAVSIHKKDVAGACPSPSFVFSQLPWIVSEPARLASGAVHPFLDVPEGTESVHN